MNRFKHEHVYFVPANEGFTDNNSTLELTKQIEYRLVPHDRVDVVSMPEGEDVITSTAKILHMGFRTRTANRDVLRVPIVDFGPQTLDDKRVLLILREAFKADLSGNVLIIVTLAQYARVMPRIFLRVFLAGDPTNADMYLSPGSAFYVNCEKKTRSVISTPAKDAFARQTLPTRRLDIFR